MTRVRARLTNKDQYLNSWKFGCRTFSHFGIKNREQQRCRSDCAAAQADLHFCCLCMAMTRLGCQCVYCVIYKKKHEIQWTMWLKTPSPISILDRTIILRWQVNIRAVNYIWDRSWDILTLLYAKNNGTDQTVHLHRLISTIVYGYFNPYKPSVLVCGT